jgi:2-dehydro-3-deoxygluconokinase
MHGGEIFSEPVTPVQGVIDTTGAGDSFNAGYLAARTRGATPVQAVQLGNRCAACVIQRRGAIVDRDEFFRELEIYW